MTAEWRAAARRQKQQHWTANLRWRAVTPTLFAVLQTLSEIHAEGSAPKQKADVRLHTLSFYTRAAGRGARGETRTPTVIGLFC